MHCEMQSISSRIWTRVAVSISYDNNDYTTGTLILGLILVSVSISVLINGHKDFVGFIHPNSHINRTGREIAIFGVCSLQRLDYSNLL